MPSLALQTELVDSLNALQGRHGEIDERTDGRPQEFRRRIDQEKLRRLNLIFRQHSNQCAGFQFVRDEKICVVPTPLPAFSASMRTCALFVISL